MSFPGLDTAAADAALKRVREAGAGRVRIGWCDLHGWLRGKTLLPRALPAALREGLGLVGTLLLKDSADRTAFEVFEPGGAPAGFGGAANLLLKPDPDSFRLLPWAPGTGWMRAQPFFADGTPVPQDPRRVLQRALSRLADAGYGLRCGLEVEFHVYRITDPGLDPAHAHWPPEPPQVELLHPGWQLLSEAHADRCEPVFAIVQQVAEGLGLPLRSLEVELGPSQVEAVFDAMDALAAADAMVDFRNGVQQALRRAGYHASFVCRPPFEGIMSSGWHLHQSLVHADGRNAFADPQAPLSATGRHWLAGLLAHARAATVFGTCTTNGFGRFRPHALAPMAVRWGRDNRGAMLRLVGGPGDPATRIENRIGEPAANPYAYIAAQIHCGLDGLACRLEPPPPTESPYADDGAQPLPTRLGEALDALLDDPMLPDAMGREFTEVYVQVKRQEQARRDAADDDAQFDRREYFSRY
ncbi:MAG: glutamine synthetase family protein [Rubrivivax sp.]